MDDIAQDFRRSKLGCVELIASPAKQRVFAAKVPYNDYASEFYCMWFEDFHPDSALFKQAFSQLELFSLRAFSAVWKEEDKHIGQVERSIEQLLANGNWCSVVEAARKALPRFVGAAT